MVYVDVASCECICIKYTTTLQGFFILLAVKTTPSATEVTKHLLSLNFPRASAHSRQNRYHRHFAVIPQVTLLKFVLDYVEISVEHDILHGR